ncbi:hypothetical protein CK203_044399 [Vitis vinifera]|uniref:Uncharacterized protein n=1 Tax=Vitis vinifera TaxID=29760 RepID=A0A438HUE7_VITVI|nr:hypothetical protein CK203_044399 [Vitis vinifera]
MVVGPSGIAKEASKCNERGSTYGVVDTKSGSEKVGLKRWGYTNGRSENVGSCAHGRSEEVGDCANGRFEEVGDNTDDEFEEVRDCTDGRLEEMGDCTNCGDKKVGGCNDIDTDEGGRAIIILQAAHKDCWGNDLSSHLSFHSIGDAGQVVVGRLKRPRNVLSKGGCVTCPPEECLVRLGWLATCTLRGGPTIETSLQFCRQQVMADALLSTSFQVLFDRLASPEVINFIRHKKLSHELLDKLESRITT